MVNWAQCKTYQKIYDRNNWLLLLFYECIVILLYVSWAISSFFTAARSTYEFIKENSTFSWHEQKANGYFTYTSQPILDFHVSVSSYSKEFIYSHLQVVRMNSEHTKKMGEIWISSQFSLFLHRSLYSQKNWINQHFCCINIHICHGIIWKILTTTIKYDVCE